jgi:starch synthase
VKILFVSAEVAPFVSVGGLSQVMYFLPRALTKLGHDVRSFTPKYGTMETTSKEGKSWRMQMEYEGLKVPIEANVTSNSSLTQDKKDFLVCNVKSYNDKRRKIRAYFLENREYYELRANVFGYMDDHIRFALLSKGCLEWLFQLKHAHAQASTGDTWFPDIIHCNDWHSAFLVELARKDKRYKQLFSKTAIVMTVHNFAYQGNYDYRYATKELKDDGSKPLVSLLSPKLQTQNSLLRGLLYADVINTVSPTHAVEVLTPEYAEGLDAALERVRGKLTGILNGLDTDEFDPATDPMIKARYSEKTFQKARRENKLELQKAFMLPEDVTRPLFAFSGRLSSQKGLDIMLDALPHVFDHRKDVQVIVLGGGDDRYRNELKELQKLYPDQLGLHLQPDFRLPRKLFAGSDFFLVPSSYEPGGIVALEALRYGTVPIVRRTGGLNDIIMDFNPAKATGNGFSFIERDKYALFGAMIEALTIYKQPMLWKKLVANCLACDFSWENVAKHYDTWYRQVLETRRRAINPAPHAAYDTPLGA